MHLAAGGSAGSSEKGIFNGLSSPSASGIGSWWSMDDAISSTVRLGSFLASLRRVIGAGFPRAIFDWSLSEGGGQGSQILRTSASVRVATEAQHQKNSCYRESIIKGAEVSKMSRATFLELRVRIFLASVTRSLISRTEVERELCFPHTSHTPSFTAQPCDTHSVSRRALSHRPEGRLFRNGLITVIVNRTATTGLLPPAWPRTAPRG